ncbi:MAG: UDP-N-acetylmuramate dehydrogenase [Gemmataceae bacterium]|nr:UDP-N-acetylmuramate dehydrogenase [Gemmataceae bacterium]
MAQTDVAGELAEFTEILKLKEPLAPFTLFKIGGPAEVMVEPRSVQELAAVVKRCCERRVPLRILGAGCSVLVNDEGVPGAVLRLNRAPFTDITAQGRRIRAGCGASLGALIAAAARHGLTGLEHLVGMPGSVGGAIRLNAGDRAGEIGQFVQSVDLLDSQGRVLTRERDDLRFSYRTSNLDEPVLLTADFELETDSTDAIVKRLRKAWIHRKASHPFSYQAATRMFKNPPGLSAAALIEQAGLVGAKVGGAQVNDRDANYVVVEPGSTARDVLRLLELVRSRVLEHFKVDLEQEISVW